MGNYTEVRIEKGVYYLYWHKEFYDEFFDEADLNEAIEYLNVLDRNHAW